MTLALKPGTHENPAKTAEELAEVFGGEQFAIAKGSEVTLQQTVYLVDSLYIGVSEEPITINLGPYDIQLEPQNQINLWSDKSAGTYADVTFAGTGKISNNGINPTIQIFAGGNLTIDGITVENGYDGALMVEGSTAGAAISTNADSCTSETETNITITSGNVVGGQGINFVSTGASDSLRITGGTVTGKLSQGVMTNSDYDGASGVINFDLDDTGKVVSEADGFSAINAFGETSIVVNGGTIEATGANSTGINIYGESSVTIRNGQISGTETGIGTCDNSEIDVNGGEISGRYGILSYGKGTLRVTKGTIRGTAVAAAGNGSDKNENTMIEIEGGTLEGGIAGIYHPQKGKLTITGGTVTGQAGIVARGGEITISGEAEIEATGTGTVTIGDEKHGGTSVEVLASAIVAARNTEYNSENMKITISGGTIKAAEGESAVVMTTNGVEDQNINHNKFDITGGTFTNPGISFTEYVDDKYVAANKGAETVVGKNLQAVVEALGVTNGDTLTVEKAPKGSSVTIVDSDITIDNQSGNNIMVNNHEITSGNEYTTFEDDFVAKITHARYASLQDAVTHAKPGDTITLLTDITLENTVHITKAITLDLGTHKITINKTGFPGAGIRGLGIVYTDATLKNGTIFSSVAMEEDTLVLVANGSLTTENMHFKTNSGCAISLYEFETLHQAQPASVTLSADSTIENEEGEGITAYGALSHYTINIEGAITVKGTHPAVSGSYQNPAGTDIIIGSTAVIIGSVLQMSHGDVLVKNGATIDNQNASASAVAITKGNLTIEEGTTIKAASNFEEYQPAADGHVSDGGSAIFVEPTEDVKVTIKGGTITSKNGYALYAPKTGNTGLTLGILGGSFTGNETKEAVSVDTLNEFISGGDYSSNVNDYIIPDKLAIEVSNHSGLDRFYVGDDAKKAIAAAKKGDTVTVYQAVEGEALKVSNGVTVLNETVVDIMVNNDIVGSGEEITVEDIVHVNGKPVLL